VPMFWTGTALLLTGVVIVAALPIRRMRPAGPTSGTASDTADTPPGVPMNEPDGAPPG